MGFVVLLVLPAILMELVILRISYPPPPLPIVEVPKRLRVVLGVGLFLLIGAIVLIAPTHKRFDVIFGIVVFGPIPLAGISGFLLQYGLRDPCRVRRWCIAVSLTLLIGGCLLLWYFASLGQLGPLFAYLTALSAAGVALVTAIWMAWSLPRWRKLTALLVGLLLPGAFLASVRMGDAQSPERITERNGDVIIQALEKHHIENGVYPTNLAELVPAHLNELPEALTTQGTGWLYTSDTREYTLGYWHYPHKFGVILCLHSSETAGWQCESTYEPRDWSPFSPVLTPIARP
jgi:hypothetical protein